MGSESRDWYRIEPPDGRKPRFRFSRIVALGVVAVALAIVFSFDLLDQNDRISVERSSQFPFVAILREPPLYAKDDPWQAYLADERTCPGGEDASRPLAAQVATMLCLIDYARDRAGLGSLSISGTLTRSARLKGEEIVRCGVFDHAPCGGPSDAGARSLGYTGSVGENLYVGERSSGSPRVALDGWLNSPGHRENLFRPEWRVQGLYAARLDSFAGYRDATLWVSQFGDR